MILTKEEFEMGWRPKQGGFVLQQSTRPTVFVSREALIWGDDLDSPPPGWTVHSGYESEALARFGTLTEALQFAEAHAALHEENRG